MYGKRKPQPVDTIPLTTFNAIYINCRTVWVPQYLMHDMSDCNTPSLNRV